jgi:hypothetical protein
MASFAQNSAVKCGNPALRGIEGGRTGDSGLRHVSLAVDALLREIAPSPAIYTFGFKPPDEPDAT